MLAPFCGKILQDTLRVKKMIIWNWNLIYWSSYQCRINVHIISYEIYIIHTVQMTFKSYDKGSHRFDDISYTILGDQKSTQIDLAFVIQTFYTRIRDGGFMIVGTWNLAVKFGPLIRAVLYSQLQKFTYTYIFQFQMFK